MTIPIIGPISSVVPGSQVVLQNSIQQSVPKEGALQAPVQINWDGATVTQHIDLGQMGLGQFSAIRALWVDNHECGSRLRIIAPDTGQVVNIPPFSSGMVPFYTSSNKFYVSSQTFKNGSPYAANNNVTNIVVYNTVQNSGHIAKSDPELLSYSQNFTLNSGTIDFPFLAGVTANLVHVIASLGNVMGAAGGSASMSPVTITDGAGNVVSNFALGVAENQFIGSSLIYSLTKSVRFYNGLTIAATLTGTAPQSGTLNLSLQYTAY